MSNATRRSVRFLTLPAVLALVAAACTSSTGPRASEPSNRPSPFPEVTRVPTKWPIKHVVFIIKENRSLDNLFGRFPGANGTRVADDHGTMRPLLRPHPAAAAARSAAASNRLHGPVVLAAAAGRVPLMDV